jgi:hypothetical protein
MATSPTSAVPAVLAGDAEEADRWRIWTDQGIVVHDPRDIPDRLERVPEGLEPKRAVMGYNTQRTIGERVTCAACGHPRNHFHGFVVEFVDGTLALVGIECGERYFGKGAWAALVAGHEHAKRAALYNARSAPAVRRLEGILPQLGEWERAIQPISEFLAELASEFPGLMVDLRRAAKSGAVMVREVATAVERQDRHGKGSDRVEYQMKRFGSVPAAELIIADSLRAELADAARMLGQAKAALEGQDPTLATQQAAFGLINRAYGILQEVDRKHRAALRLFDPAFWVAVCKWANTDSSREGNFRFKHGRLRQSDAEYEYGMLVVPVPSAVEASPWPAIAAEWPRL